MLQKVLEMLRALTRHRFVKVVNCGNAAIFSALHRVKARGATTVLVPDQGGWISYSAYPRILGMTVTYLATIDGLIDLEDLRKKVGKNTALIYSSLAAYSFAQDIRAIHGICKEGGAFVIMDCSGSV